MVVCGIVEHIEEAGVHSGDSACILPPHSLDREAIEEIERETIAMARALPVVGLINIQFAVQNKRVYVVDLIKSRSVSLVMNVPESGKALADSRPIRLAALEHGIPYITTFEAARAAVKAMCAGLHSNTVRSIQDYYGGRHRT